MKNISRTFVVAACLFSGCLQLQANDQGEVLSAENARQIIRQFIESMSSYQANFTQTLQNDTGEVLEEEAGRLWLQRPGKFHWEYTVPWERQIIANEDSIWLYDAELEQVTVRSAQGALLKSPAALLVGDMTALEDYSFSGSGEADGSVIITLEPLTGHGDFQSIGLGFAKGQLVSLDLYDQFGQHTHILFYAIVPNPPLDSSLFLFVPPQGADVIDQRIN